MDTCNSGQTRLAVIMACHNRRPHTLACLRALKQQSFDDEVSIRVFLLDDGSTDGTSQAVNTEFPDVRILSGDGSLYWNRGMFQSFSAAIEEGSDFYLWLNDDCTLYPHALQTLLYSHRQLCEQGSEDSIIGSAMQDPDTGAFSYGGVKRHRSKMGRVRLERIAPEDRLVACDATNGNCVLIPDSVVRKVGNLDPIFLHRWGDHDYCFRALQAGCTVWLAPGYMGQCKENPLEGTWEDRSLPALERIRKLNSPQGMQFRDYAIYMRRHRGPWWPAHLLWPYVKIAMQTLKK